MLLKYSTEKKNVDYWKIFAPDNKLNNNAVTNLKKCS